MGAWNKGLASSKGLTKPTSYEFQRAFLHHFHLLNPLPFSPPLTTSLKSSSSTTTPTIPYSLHPPTPPLQLLVGPNRKWQLFLFLYKIHDQCFINHGPLEHSAPLGFLLSLNEIINEPSAREHWDITFSMSSFLTAQIMVIVYGTPAPWRLKVSRCSTEFYVLSKYCLLSCQWPGNYKLLGSRKKCFGNEVKALYNQEIRIYKNRLCSIQMYSSLVIYWLRVFNVFSKWTAFI